MSDVLSDMIEHYVEERETPPPPSSARREIREANSYCVES
jgi:hypothetical protein